MSAIWESDNWTRQFGIRQTGNQQFVGSIYHTGGSVFNKGFNIPWMKIDPGVNLPWGSKYHMTPVIIFIKKVVNVSMIHETFFSSYC